MNQKSTPKPGENVWLWLLKIILGLFIIVLLGVHFIVNHTVAEGGLQSYADVIKYFSNPWIVAMEITFLVVVISHSLIGIRSILLDLNPTRRLMGFVNLCLLLLGVTSVSYGIWLALVIAERG